MTRSLLCHPRFHLSPNHEGIPLLEGRRTHGLNRQIVTRREPILEIHDSISVF